jgi:hypothetical protein
MSMSSEIRDIVPDFGKPKFVATCETECDLFGNNERPAPHWLSVSEANHRRTSSGRDKTAALRPVEFQPLKSAKRFRVLPGSWDVPMLIDEMGETDAEKTRWHQRLKKAQSKLYLPASYLSVPPNGEGYLEMTTFPRMTRRKALTQAAELNRGIVSKFGRQLLEEEWYIVSEVGSFVAGNIDCHISDGYGKEQTIHDRPVRIVIPTAAERQACLIDWEAVNAAREEVASV